MNYKWKLSDQADDEIISSLAGQLKVKPIIARLLVQRGFDSSEKANLFSIQALMTSMIRFLMDGMENAVDRVLQSIRAQ